ncbi:MAG: HEPN domain-containing protein [Phycisphaerales bacterium]|nr:MAG: HEPN domain-containing protein [Phycisphaerales bacterium]
MKTSLDHLPERKRQDLVRLAHLIRETFSHDVEMIILYGSYARGDYKEERDLPPKHERKSGHASDYDILILTNSEDAAESIEMRTLLDRKAAKLNLSARPRFIADDIAAFNQRLEEARFFYTDIVSEGIMLFDTKRHTLAAISELSPPERYRMAQEYYEHWFESANEFFMLYDFSRNEHLHKKAAFNLHQTAEAAYKTVLLVFTGYSPDQHWLAILADHASRHAPGIEDCIPQDGPNDESRLFKLLDYAYIGARYDAKYTITERELDELAGRVRALLEHTQAACTAELNRLNPG